MNSSDLEVYEQLKPKLGEKETKSLLKDEIGKVLAELLVIKWMLVAVLAGTFSLVLKAFFI